MNNEPVAWKHKPSGVIFDEIIEAAEPNDLIPLYTHPVKELTDEEIDNMLVESFNRGKAFGYAEGLRKASE
jgi:hypothetical protein